MRAIDLGKYFIRTTSNPNRKIEVKEGTTLALSEGDIYAFDNALDFAQYDTVFYVHLLESSAELAIIYDRYAQGNNIKTFHINVGDLFVVSSTQCEIVYECSDDHLEEAIHAFKNNQLTGDYDIKTLLIQYAKRIGITEKQAVYYIVTTIDVPEVEGNELPT